MASIPRLLHPLLPLSAPPPGSSGVGNCTDGRCSCPPGYLDQSCAMTIDCKYWDQSTQA